MKTYIYGLLALFSVASCTSLSEGNSTDPLPNPEHNRRVMHTGGNLDHARKQMNVQSSGVNRKLNIEQGTDGSASTPTTQRSQEVTNAPVDTTTHNVQWPLRNRVTPGN